MCLFVFDFLTFQIKFIITFGISLLNRNTWDLCVSFLWLHKETNSSETALPLLIKSGVAGVGDNIHLALCAFWADLMALPALAAFLSTALMTPTATVCLMSQIENGPEEDNQSTFQHTWSCLEPYKKWHGPGWCSSVD